MTKSEIQRLESKKREWDEGLRPIEKFWKEIKEIIKDEKDKMMYCKKSKDKTNRRAEEFFWWVKLVFIFFAFKGLTYWLTGR